MRKSRTAKKKVLPQLEALYENDKPDLILELVSIGKANAEIIEFEVDDQAAITRQMLKDISFPKDALINAIIRNGDE